MDIRDIKDALKAGPVAFPGGYPLYFLASDGEALSFEAVRANLREVLRVNMTGDRLDFWHLHSVLTNWEDPSLYCCHTNKRIPSAYAEDEALV